MTNKQILEDQSAPIMALVYVVTLMYGTECFEWEPEMLATQLSDDVVQLTELQSDKLQAGILLLTTNQYQTNIHVFETVTHLLNNAHSSFDEMLPLEVEELICGLADVYLLSHEILEFSPEVRCYAGKLFYDYGFHKAPDLMHDAIMPHEAFDGDDEDKNETLHELFNYRIATTKAYMDKCHGSD